MENDSDCMSVPLTSSTGREQDPRFPHGDSVKGQLRESLEREVAGLTNISSKHDVLLGRVLHTWWHTELQHPVRAMKGIVDSCKRLQESKLLKDHFTILVRDPERSGVVLAVPIDFAFLESLQDDLADMMACQTNRSINLTLMQFKDLFAQLRVEADTAVYEHITHWRKLVQSELPNKTTEILVKNLLYLSSQVCNILALGVLAYTGSHTHAFDKAFFGSKIASFKVTNYCVLRRRHLACLDDLICGPAWVFGVPGPDACTYAVSISLKGFGDLWDPVWSIASEDEEDTQPCKAIQTERGYFYAVMPGQNSSRANPDETPCHWLAGQSITNAVPLSEVQSNPAAPSGSVDADGVPIEPGINQHLQLSFKQKLLIGAG